MDQGKDNNYESGSRGLNFFDEIRTIPPCWDLSSIMETPHASKNGRLKTVDPDAGISDFDEHQYSMGEHIKTFDDWYLGAYLDMEDNPGPWNWYAF